ncbi:MAG: Fic family protein [Bacilli bacterium]|nr:Fic family protein [Bacilli bacterium]
MIRKYNMTKEDNIFFAKRKLIDNLYKSANLEGIAVTFADTVAFVNNVNTGKISVDDMLKLKGLKDAWEYVLNTIDEELTIDYIKKIHFEVCKGQNIEPLGDFRDRGVGITGTSYRPKLPSECNYDKELNDIMKVEDSLDKSITLFLWIQRSQMFLDGNKRVANLVANKEMIKNGLGILAVPVEKIGEYFTILIEFYETNDYTNIKKWIYDNCIDGVE